MKAKTFVTFACTAFLWSCTVQKQLQKTAQQYVLNDPALQTAHVGISVYEPATDKYWFNYQGDKYFVPASNTKLPICYAAMKYLGDSLVGLTYKEYSDKIVFKGTADPTFLNSEYKSQPVYNFLKNNYNKKLEWDYSNWDDDALGNGWSWNDYLETYMAHRSPLPMYGNLLTVKIITADSFQTTPKYFQTQWMTFDSELHPAVTVTRDLFSNKLSVVKGQTNKLTITFHPDLKTIEKLLSDTLKKEISFQVNSETKSLIHSQPTDSLLKPMMHRSDNFFAEQSLLMVSNEVLGYMNNAKIIDTILKTDFKDLPQKPRWVDGSGLSRYNLFTPQDMLAILNKMKNEFGMERIKNILPTGGTGTLSNYYVKDSGYIFAKTGTLSGVVALSGFLYTQKGKLLIFSTLVNNHNASASGVRRAVEKFIEGIRQNY